MRTQLLVAVMALAGVGSLTAQDRPAEILGAGGVSRYPEVLQAAGIVRELTRAPQITYVCSKIIEITYAD